MMARVSAGARRPARAGTTTIIDYQMGSGPDIQTAQSATRSTGIPEESQFVPTQGVSRRRGEMKLPFGEKSFVGASVLWQDASSRETVPKINQEPYSKLLLDMNMAIDLSGVDDQGGEPFAAYLHGREIDRVHGNGGGHSRTTRTRRAGLCRRLRGSKETFPWP